MNTVINIRIDKSTKDHAQKTLESIGLDLSSGVKLFLNQVITEQGIPFTPTKNRISIRAKWDAEAKEALKGKGYKSGGELHKAILGKKAYASLSN